MLTPISPGDWDEEHAGHLLNRAGFGGTPAEIGRLAALTPAGAVSSLVDFEKIPDHTPAPVWAKPDPDRQRRVQAMRQAPEPERRKLQQQERELERDRMLELRGWWLERMAAGPRPFQEKMTLFWHGHFATSVEKVRDAYYMWRQNELFRRLGTGSWLELLTETAKDPAMLVWLDQAQSRKEHPNENFAREVMELFALGEGHYTERDVAEAARAFTGWSLDRADERFVERKAWHDNGMKTVLGRTGDLDGTAVLAQIVAQPQASVFITGKIWAFFAGAPPSPAVNAALAAVFRQYGGEFKPMLRAMFLSEEFYAPEVVRNQVKSPVQWLVGSVRLLEIPMPPAQMSTNLLRGLGQDLFAPPNVKGWDGGVAWITTSNLLARYNASALLIEGRKPGKRPAPAGGPADAATVAMGTNAPAPAVIPERGFEGVRADALFAEVLWADPDALVQSVEKRFLQARLRPDQEQTLRKYVGSRKPIEARDVRGAIRLVMSTPDYQVS